MTECSPPPHVTGYMSRLMRHMLRVMCHVSHVTCQMTRVMCQIFILSFSFFLFLQNGGATQKGDKSTHA